MAAHFKASEIADFYIQLFTSLPDNSIDNLKLNKMLYFAQSWSMVKFEHPLFNDQIEAWDHGPVIPEVYRTYKRYGSKPIEKPQDRFDEGRLTSDELELLVDVYTTYGKYTGWALRDMTHENGTPWSQVYEKGKNNVISTESMKQYYSQNGHLDAFRLKDDNSNIITEVPLKWDSSEDGIYD